MDIDLLTEPRGSESPGSKKSSISIASNSTGATMAYTTAPSAYTQSPAYAHFSAYAAPTAILQVPFGFNRSPPTKMLKRATSQTSLTEERPAKKHPRWTLEEDTFTIELRG
ncbi:hypothetical protein GQ44DRAFT_733498 [Phaeosphaeriaceae sp. PMI808]|nr:hypothetical protein GQ44DRAFT_733498 [Phaeosphaeriaceae sp. PMI808]